MNPGLFAACIFLSCLSLHAQVRCIEDEEGNCIAKGKLKSYTQKNSYGGKFEVTIRIDKWEFFSTDGGKIGEGVYKEKEKSSYMNGEWIFYTDDGRVLFKRWYNFGVIGTTEYIDTGCYAYQNDHVCITSDSFGALTISEKRGSLDFQYKTQLNVKINGDTYNLSKARGTASRYTLPQSSSPTYHMESDASILLRYPHTRATLNIKPWAVNSPLNLIRNGDFELCREQMLSAHNSQIKPQNEHFAKFWGSSHETPDIYKKDDQCYAGFRVMGVNFEVLRNQLVKPLEEGKTYCMQFKLKLKSENAFAFNGVSVVCSKELLGFNNSAEGFKRGVVIQTHPDMVLGCREQWMIISGSFEASGGEQYIYISNFTDPKILRLFKVDSTAAGYVDEIYYYIDDVVLIEEQSDYKCPCNTKGCELEEEPAKDTIPIVEEDIFNHPKVGQKLILRNIQFETAKWSLLDASFETLDSLVELMNKFPGMRVEISGHTDNRGNKKSNETLSFNRAKAVVQFLVESGIDESRMEYKGYGQEQPIDSNDTEEGRFNNRRVEFVILEL
jgi:outer membrane protein OmpA-like peptidoglycan-associated protein